MKKEWFLVVLVIGLAAVLNGCCTEKVCPDCGLASSAQSQGFDASQMGSGSASRSIK